MDVLPPWEANRWFANPTAVSVFFAAPGTQQLVAANPMRVGLLLMDPNGGQTAWIYGIDPNTGSTSGQRFPVNLGHVLLSHRDLGPLVQQPWYANAPTGNVHVTVIELLLRDWPQPDPDMSMDVADYLDYIAGFVKQAAKKQQSAAG